MKSVHTARGNCAFLNERQLMLIISQKNPVFLCPDAQPGRVWDRLVILWVMQERKWLIPPIHSTQSLSCTAGGGTTDWKVTICYHKTWWTSVCVCVWLQETSSQQAVRNITISLIHSPECVANKVTEYLSGAQYGYQTQRTQALIVPHRTSFSLHDQLEWWRLPQTKTHFPAP